MAKNTEGPPGPSKLIQAGAISGIISLIVLIISGLFLVVPNFTVNDNKNVKIATKTESIIREIENIPDKLLYENKKITYILRYQVDLIRFDDMNKKVLEIFFGFDNVGEIISKKDFYSDSISYMKERILFLLSPYRLSTEEFVGHFIEYGDYFDLFPKKDKILKYTNEDCKAFSVQRAIHDSFKKIIGTVTIGYATIAVVNRWSKDEYAAQNRSDDAAFRQRSFEYDLKRYNEQIAIVTNVVKLVLKDSSREMRNCGSFPLKEGETFERVHLKGMGISTQLVTAQLGNVITGIRWRVEENIIYLDIQQGKFIDKLSVDNSTVFWTKTPANESEVVFINEKLRSIDLSDSILSSPNHYVTGVRMYANFLRGLIGLSVTGVENPNIKLESKPVPSPCCYENNYREELVLDKADDPLDYKEHGYYSEKTDFGNVYREPNHYVRFQPSTSGLNKTIPLLDVREMATNPPAPISGIGIYHQAHPGYGGFLGLRLFSPTLEDLMDPKLYENSTTKVVEGSFNNMTFFTEYYSRHNNAHEYYLHNKYLDD